MEKPGSTGVVTVSPLVIGRYVKYINATWLVVKEKSDCLYMDKEQWIVSSDNH